METTDSEMTLERLADRMQALRKGLNSVIVGQAQATEFLLVALLSQGHVLLEGVPGTGKTLLARTFAELVALEFGRIQFTPDLMPGDLIGSNLFDFQTSRFNLVKGPIFTDILLADEINRTPPKTQAALLQAMQERSVTLDRDTHDLGAAFMVIATQNPIEQEGTYPLPEAQLDRFLFKINIDYPTRDEERRMVHLHGTSTTMPELDDFQLTPALTLPDIEASRRLIRSVTLTEPLIDYIVDIIRETRVDATLLTGASPRAANMLAMASRAVAAINGRDYVIPDDVKALAAPTLAHRFILTAGAEIEGMTPARVLNRILERVPAPR